MTDSIRINKYLADQGFASRREADALIAAGKVEVNGKTAVLGQKVSAGDKVSLSKTNKKRLYLAYYKGRGIITHSPSSNETDILSKLQADYQNKPELKEIYPVGRLDKDSEGLMILTNDGRITGPLLDPASNHEKEYEVRVDKPINNSFLKKMTVGVNIEGYQTKSTKVKQKGETTILVTLTEGKKHQIRRMCAALGYQVKFLKRVRIMNIHLGKLKPNQFRKFSGPEQKDFLNELNLK